MDFEKENIDINGIFYKRITAFISGIRIWKKDTLLVEFGTHASGCHLIFANTKQDHFDHLSGAFVWKEYINK